MSANHSFFHFSVKVHTSDNAVLHCLRALNQWAQLGAGFPLSIGWGGTGKRKRSSVKDGFWETLRFTSEERRAAWEAKANELLPGGAWAKGETRDDDPAEPVR